MMRGDGETRSRESAFRLGRLTSAAVALNGFIILLRVSALTEGTWALGGLLFGAGAMGALWNYLYRSETYREFFAPRSGAKALSLGMILLLGVAALALCAIVSTQALRLVLLALLIAVQIFSVPLVERAERLSQKARAAVLMALHLALDGVMLLLTSSLSQRADARGCFAAYAVGGAVLFGCRKLPEPAQRRLTAEEKLPASFSLWLQTVSTDVMTGVFCGVAFMAEVSLRTGTPTAILLLAIAVLTGVLAGTRLAHSEAEYAVVQRRGIGCWLLAAVLCLLWKDSAIPAVFILPLFGLGCAFLVSGLLAMREPFQLLLGEAEENGDVRDYLNAGAIGALLPAGLMLLTSLAVAICFLPCSSRIVTPALTLFSLAIGFVFLVRSWLFTTRQPLDRAGSKKIRRFAAQSSDAENLPLAGRVREIFVQPYTRSVGFWIIKTLFRPIFPSRFLGAKNVASDSGAPMIFVCNHLEIYGPIITQLHLPYSVRTWIINTMVEQDLTEENLSGAVNKIFRIFSDSARRKICHLLARPVCWAMNSIDHVTVYRGRSRDVIRTIRDTVEAIECGDNILLFPENTGAEGETGAYKIGEVSAFFSGFSNIAASVYEKTGLCVTFYPLFADKKKKKIRAGKGITFDPSQSRPEEKKRIVEYLHDTMCQMAEIARQD